ncbi:competence type IV pilus minor pilin ComGD [Microbacteriaceae bacterium 4G12]
MRSYSRTYERGFTLLETLLVLFIVSVLATVGYMNLQPIYEHRKIEQFVEQFQQDVIFMQQAALSNNRRYALRLYPEQHKYNITQVGAENATLVRYYDSQLNIDIGTLPQPLTYRENGNINRAGTMYVSYKNRKYSIVFQIGKGRFSYHEV